ncbi:hypothetical protein HY483_01090 [Candidatus Woesearchaeota archaeon]|nr:hypothetical protein [Candidatus Woesearchaeota archaeon]
MQITITKEEENKFLERKEITGNLLYQGTTPSKIILTEEIAKRYNAEKNNVVIKNIKTKYGLQEGTISAVVYSNEKAKKRSEPITKHQKGGATKKEEGEKK